MIEDIKKEYAANGFVIVRNAIALGLANEIENHVHWLNEKYPDIRPEALHHNLLVHDPFIHHLLKCNKLLKENHLLREATYIDNFIL